MKKWVMVLFIATVLQQNKAHAQAEEAQQLLLNVEKLAQLKEILTNLKEGYEVLSIGYATIKDLSEGNFSLHRTFLDGLSEVSPVVRNYKKVGDIIANQLTLVKEYKRAYNHFKEGGIFTPGEIKYLSNVYAHLFNQSVKNLDVLLKVITSGSLRMSDEDRLGAIDKIFLEMQDKLMFLRHFNNQTALLSLQRTNEIKDAQVIQNIHGITK